MGNYKPLLFSLGFILILGGLFIMVGNSFDIVVPEPTGLKGVFVNSINGIMSFFTQVIFLTLALFEIIPNFFMALSNLSSLSWGVILNPLINIYNFFMPTLVFPFLAIQPITTEGIITFGFADLSLEFMVQLSETINDNILFLTLLPNPIFNILFILLSVALVYGIIKMVLP